MISWKKALDLEIRVAKIINEQELNGVGFDIVKAKKDVQYLSDFRDKLYKKIRPELEPEISNPYSVPVNKPFLMSGGYSKASTDWMKEDVKLIGGPFTRIEFVEPDIGSRVKLAEQLLKHGWKPTQFTPTGRPQITYKGEPVASLTAIKGEIGSRIAKWYTAGHRRSQIEGWIRDIRPDGRLMAGADSCGTNKF